MLPSLTIADLISSAQEFSALISQERHANLIGLNDGKTVGTYMEHCFKEYLQSHFEVEIGNSAYGIDLPSPDILTDIKVTSFSQPQSSCPFKSARQKIFGLGYNLLIFVYAKDDAACDCPLKIIHCTFIDKAHTGDYTLTTHLRTMVAEGANHEDIVGYLQDRNLPGDEIVLQDLANEILANPPEQGVLTISNALQWRLHYSRAFSSGNSLNGVLNFDY